MKSTNKKQIKVKAFSWYGINVEASKNPDYKLKSSSSIYWPFWLNQPMFVFATQTKMWFILKLLKKTRIIVISQKNSNY